MFLRDATFLVLVWFFTVPAYTQQTIDIDRNEAFSASCLIKATDALSSAFPSSPYVYPLEDNAVNYMLDPSSGYVTEYIELSDLLSGSYNIEQYLTQFKMVLTDSIYSFEDVPVESAQNFTLSVNYITKILEYDNNTVDQSQVRNFFTYINQEYGMLFSMNNLTLDQPVLQPQNLTEDNFFKLDVGILDETEQWMNITDWNMTAFYEAYYGMLNEFNQSMQSTASISTSTATILTSILGNISTRGSTVTVTSTSQIISTSTFSIAGSTASETNDPPMITFPSTPRNRKAFDNSSKRRRLLNAQENTFFRRSDIDEISLDTMEGRVSIGSDGTSYFTIDTEQPQVSLIKFSSIDKFLDGGNGRPNDILYISMDQEGFYYTRQRGQRGFHSNMAARCKQALAVFTNTEEAGILRKGSIGLFALSAAGTGFGAMASGYAPSGTEGLIKSTLGVSFALVASSHALDVTYQALSRYVIPMYNKLSTQSQKNAQRDYLDIVLEKFYNLPKLTDEEAESIFLDSTAKNGIGRLSVALDIKGDYMDGGSMTKGINRRMNELYDSIPESAYPGGNGGDGKVLITKSGLYGSQKIACEALSDYMSKEPMTTDVLGGVNEGTLLADLGVDIDNEYGESTTQTFKYRLTRSYAIDRSIARLAGLVKGKNTGIDFGSEQVSSAAFFSDKRVNPILKELIVGKDNTVAEEIKNLQKSLVACYMAEGDGITVDENVGDMVDTLYEISTDKMGEGVVGSYLTEARAKALKLKNGRKFVSTRARNVRSTL